MPWQWSVTVLLLLLWLGISLLFRLRFQFSLRSMMLFVVVVAVVCSWFSVRMQEARRQRETVEAVEKPQFIDTQQPFQMYQPGVGKLGKGTVSYDYELDANGNPLRGTPEPCPPWLRNLVGVDFLSDVRQVQYGQATDIDLVHLRGLPSLELLGLMGTQVTDGGLVHLKGLTNLETLDLGVTRVTDAGLEHLRGLTKLEGLWLNYTQVTDEGVKKFREALPSCKIHR